MSNQKHHPHGRTPIGIDLGAHSIKAVQLRAGADGRWGLGALACLPRSTPGSPVQSEEIARLAATLDRAGFSGTRAVLAVPAVDLISGMLELPPRVPGMPFEQIARME